MPKTYNLSMRIIHWIMAIIIIGLIASGWYMVDISAKDPIKWTFYGIHKSFGVIIIGLIFLRVIVRVRSSIPPLLTGFPKWTVILAKLVHGLLYIAMILIPLTGYIMSDAGGYGVKLFGISMPDFLEKNKEIAGLAHNLHGVLPYVLLAIIIVHIAGALKDKRVLMRMVK